MIKIERLFTHIVWKFLVLIKIRMQKENGFDIFDMILGIWWIFWLLKKVARKFFHLQFNISFKKRGNQN